MAPQVRSGSATVQIGDRCEDGCFDVARLSRYVYWSISLSAKGPRATSRPSAFDQRERSRGRRRQLQQPGQVRFFPRGRAIASSVMVITATIAMPMFQ